MFDVTFLEPNTTQEQLRKHVINRVIACPQFVSSICIYSQHIPYVKASLLHFPHVKMGTVLNFPKGNMDLRQVKAQTKQAIIAGAEEFDLVVPWYSYDGSREADQKIDLLVNSVRKLIGDKAILKVILETGEIDIDFIIPLGFTCIITGANFLKTSTGKTDTGATVEGVREICCVLNENRNWGRSIPGIKISGGVNNLVTVNTYLQLIKNRIYQVWGTPIRFGVGPSSTALEEYTRNYF